MLPITVTIHYPSDLDTLIRWSKCLFAVYCVGGLTGSAAFFGSIVLAFWGQPVWLLVGIPLGLALSSTAPCLERLMSEVDARRYAALEAKHTDQV